MWTTAAVVLCALTIPLLRTTVAINTKSPPTFVAFSVGKTSHQFGQGRVEFERVFLNIGNGFKTNLNVFIAPVDGVYQFTASALNYVDGQRRKELFIDMYKNNDYLLSVYESQTNFGQAGNSLLLQLFKDDQVYLTLRNDDGGLYGTPAQVYATFSGHLLVPIYQVTTYIAGVVATNPQTP